MHWPRCRNVPRGPEACLCYVLRLGVTWVLLKWLGMITFSPISNLHPLVIVKLVMHDVYYHPSDVFKHNFERKTRL